MLVNVMVDKDDVTKTGYTNVYYHAVQGLLDDGEADEIHSLNVIDTLDFTLATDTIQCWARKLKHNGILTVGFIDLYYLCHAICDRTLNVIDANKYLYGHDNRLHKCSLSMDYISKLLTGLGLKILMKRIVDGRAIIKAQRP